MKIWLITGSSRGLGRAMAEAVLGKGDRLLATARKTQGLDDLAEHVGNSIATFPLDVADAAAATEALNMAVSKFGRLDVLVNDQSRDSNHARTEGGTHHSVLIVRRTHRRDGSGCILSREMGRVPGGLASARTHV